MRETQSECPPENALQELILDTSRTMRVLDPMAVDS
jgi:hypothetical protein